MKISRPVWVTELNFKKICQLLITHISINVCLYLLSKPLALAPCVSPIHLNTLILLSRRLLSVLITVPKNGKMVESQGCCEICSVRQTPNEVN